MEAIKVILKKGRERSLVRRHPWVFSGAIQRFQNLPEGQREPEEGVVVTVADFKGKGLGQGFYQPGSVAVKIFVFGAEPPESNWWEEKIRLAWKKRQSLLLDDSETTNVFRVIHAEGDGLPGLVVDYYYGTAVILTYSVGMHHLRNEIAKALVDVAGGKIRAVYDKSAEVLPERFSPRPENDFLIGETEGKSEVLENGYRIWVDFIKGQKTGFFVDQRDNRNWLAQYARDKKVLNTFCYSGGFSVYALGAGAQRVVSVDSSPAAVKLAEDNVQLNEFEDRHEAIVSDTLTYLKSLEEKFDLIVLDPPAYAKSVSARHRAIQAYKRLNALAMKKLVPGGILFTFSCSGVVDRKLFYDTIVAAAIESGRKPVVLHHLSQPPDHPVNIFHPEGEYLKGLILMVD